MSAPDVVDTPEEDPRRDGRPGAVDRECDRGDCFVCPRCDEEPFDDAGSWAGHLREEHGVEGPL